MKRLPFQRHPSGRARIKAVIGVVLGILAVGVVWHFVAQNQRDYGMGGDKAVRVSAGIDHAEYELLLNTYVDERGLVDYAAWKASDADMRALETYLGQYAREAGKAAEGAELSASLINGYNAFAIKSVLDRYPVDSIMSLRHPFEARRHTVGGEMVSLNDIEHATLIPHFGYRSHAVLVCVARSCPPLRREAYKASTVAAQADDNFQIWLGREDLNRFHPGENLVEISSVFTWFRDDFKKGGGLREVLARHAPAEHREFLSGEDYSIEFLPYNWTLNNANPEDFSTARLVWNRFLDFFR